MMMRGRNPEQRRGGGSHHPGRAAEFMCVLINIWTH